MRYRGNREMNNAYKWLKCVIKSYNSQLILTWCTVHANVLTSYLRLYPIIPSKNFQKPDPNVKFSAIINTIFALVRVE